MKKTAEDIVPEDVDLKEKIIELAEANKCWIFLSNGLVERLKKKYPDNRPYAIGDGWIFYMSPEHETKLFVDEDRVWNKVSMIPKKGVYVSDDPEILYFLS